MTDFAKRYQGASDYRLAQLMANQDGLVPEAREALRAEVARRAPQTTLSPTQAEHPVTAKDPLDGISGWLGWYCLGLFTGAYYQVRMALTLHGGVRSVMLAFAIFCVGMAAWNLATAISMLRSARFTLKMILIHQVLGTLQGVILMADGIAGVAAYATFFPSAVVLIIMGVAICASYAIWFRYFQVSKRVKITFGRNL